MPDCKTYQKILWENVIGSREDRKLNVVTQMKGLIRGNLTENSDQVVGDNQPGT